MLSFVVDESILMRAIGGPAVMRAQLQRLLDLGQREHVAIRVLPLSLGEHVGLRGPFVLLKFAGTNDPDVVYIEQRRGDALFQEEAEVIANHQRLFAVHACSKLTLAVRSTLTRLRPLAFTWYSAWLAARISHSIDSASCSVG